MNSIWTSRTLAAPAVALALALAACGGETATLDEVEETTPEEMETTPEEEAMAEATVAVASSDLGDILVDGDGNTLYGFLPDAQAQPTCTGMCAETWPPLAGPAEGGEELDADLLGTVDHPDGATQVTYNGWPLYRYSGDEATGDTNGQGVGDNWYVVGSDGQPIQETEAQGAAGY